MSKDCAKRDGCQSVLRVVEIVDGKPVGEPVWEGLECDLAEWARGEGAKYTPHNSERVYEPLRPADIEALREGRVTLEELRRQTAREMEARIWLALAMALASLFAEEVEETPEPVPVTLH